MATIDLAAAYRAVDALLAEHGRKDPYAVDVRVWNHRDRMQIEVYIYVVPEAPESVVSGGPAPDVEAALAALRAKLAARFPVEPLIVPLPSVCAACDHAEHGRACEVETGGLADDRPGRGGLRVTFLCGCTGDGPVPPAPDLLLDDDPDDEAAR